MLLQTLFLAARAAHAAELDSGIDYELFKPHADFYGYSATPGASTLQNWQLGASLWFDYSDDPVVLVDASGVRVSPNASDEDGLVNSKVGAHAQVGVGITRFGSVTVDVPFTLAQDGFSPPALGDATASRLAVSGIGDIVLAPKVVVLDRDYFPVGLAVAIPVALPTGDATQLMGEGAVSLAPQVTLEWSDAKIHTRGYKFRAAATGGMVVREAARIADTRLGNAFLYGLGLGYHVIEPLEVVLDFHGNTSGERGSQNPAEVLVGGKVYLGDFVSIGLGGGTGLFGGIGAPDFRVYGGVGIAPSLDPANRDTDRDDVPDGRDKCPNDKEDKDNFQDDDGCPELDNDADGREDTVDQCPNDPEDDDGFMDNDGCPEKDNDKDGINDPDDQCPNEVGQADMGGCPNRDTDGDGIGDDLDRCPYDAEDVDGDRDEDGCPDEGRVVVEKNFIRINDLIYFDFNKATIQERSYDLLDEIAKVILANPQLLKIRIEGHTDNVGNDIANLRLSQARAESVKAYLQTRGVSGSTLDAAGFGEMRPIATNDNEDGRAQNRRVEFIIVDQK
jgi:outer membrane protein OmpA-like peptidoglycan-associated protein